jgi:hypothetical protein
LVEFAEAFRILWAAQLAAKTREVDKALEGLRTTVPDPQNGSFACLGGDDQERDKSDSNEI